MGLARRDKLLFSLAHPRQFFSQTTGKYSSYVKSYSYQQCTFDKDDGSVMTSRGAHLLDDTDESLQKVVAEYGPVATGLHVSDNLKNYHSAVFSDGFCENEQTYMNEPVLVVSCSVD